MKRSEVAVRLSAIFGRLRYLFRLWINQVARTPGAGDRSRRRRGSGGSRAPRRRFALHSTVGTETSGRTARAVGSLTAESLCFELRNRHTPQGNFRSSSFLFKPDFRVGHVTATPGRVCGWVWQGEEFAGHNLGSSLGTIRIRLHNDQSFLRKNMLPENMCETTPQTTDKPDSV
ncbi:hypothetical protein Bbelb_187290 [Branchiostoma belcheri]|nr:hypothetical protein Bbelb_187290 [Branchiostoma belcheri]